MVLVHTGPITAGQIPNLVIDAAKIAANAVETAEITNANVTKAKYADAVVIRSAVTISQDGVGLTGGVGYMPFDGDIVACGFTNDSAAAFTVAAKITTTGDVCSSNATLADNTSERVTSMTAAYAEGLSKGDAITLTTGTAGAGPTYAMVEVEGKLSGVA